MTPPDVDGGDMNPDELSPEQLAALLDADPAAFPGHPVAEALRSARASLAAEAAPVPTAALSEFLAADPVVTPIPLSPSPAVVDDLPVADESNKRRTPVLQTIAAFVGTIAGKVVIGTTVAAASVGAAHAGGVVDVPGLPEIDEPAVVDIIDDESDDADEVEDPDVSDDPDGGDDSEDRGASDDDSVDPDDSDDASDDSDDTDDRDDGDDDSDDGDDDRDDDSDDDDDGGGDDDDRDDDSPTTTTSTAPGSIVDQQYRHTEPGVGTSVVAVQGGQLVYVSATPAAGWTVSEAGPDEDGVDTSFEQGELEVDIDFEIDDGRLRIRVRTENDATDEETEVFHWVDL